MLGLKFVGWFILVVMLLGAVPGWLHAGEPAWIFGVVGWRWLGGWLLLNGFGLSLWSAALFGRFGRGTPLPFAPPQRLVMAGPYRFVRNPMLLGYFLLLGGQALLMNSQRIFLYLLQVITISFLYIVFVEEPQLAKRFGSAYGAYRRDVPRWIPRKPISAASSPKTR